MRWRTLEVAEKQETRRVTQALRLRSGRQAKRVLPWGCRELLGRAWTTNRLHNIAGDRITFVRLIGAIHRALPELETARS